MVGHRLRNQLEFWGQGNRVGGGAKMEGTGRLTLGANEETENLEFGKPGEGLVPTEQTKIHN